MVKESVIFGTGGRGGGGNLQSFAEEFHFCLQNPSQFPWHNFLFAIYSS